jgi:hypothetical protein
MAIRATECCSGAAANVPETRRKFTKDVKINGTNPTSHLESTKVPKNELKTNPKNVQNRPKNVPRVRQEAQTNRKSDPKRPNSGGYEKGPSTVR